MNFRVNLAVALAAALSFACADKQAAIPELEEAMKAPPGRVTVGLYKMTVTPVQGPNGLSFAQQIIPVGRDGNPLTNPPNTLQVAGQFSGVVTNAPGCPGVNALTAPVRITNFTLDPLRNVWADIVDMTGAPGNTSCNSSSIALGNGFFGPGDTAQGIWKYNDLAASTDGIAAGGNSLPISTGGVWALRYTNTQPFQFYFVIQADDNTPAVNFVDPAGPSQPLTFTSAASSSAKVEICSADPGFIRNSPCPGVLVTNTAPPGVGAVAGPWSFSSPVNGLNPGATYWWRARNTYAAGDSQFASDWVPFTFNGSTPTVPTTTTFLANLPATFGAVAELTWTTVPAQTDTWAVLCAGSCTAAVPNIVFNGAVPWDLFTPGNYVLDVTGLLLTDINTLTYFDPAITYELRVYNYDGFSAGPAIADPHSPGTVNITAVAQAPTVTASPAAFSLAAATWPVTWTADARFATTVIDVCVPNCTTPVDFYVIGQVVTPALGVYSVDLFTLMVTNAPANPILNTETFELLIQNPDLVGVFGASVVGTVTP
jgi:hypothetical protein